MNKVILSTITAVALATGMAFAAGEPAVIKGTIIDNMCAAAHSADIGEAIKSHEKTCAIMPDCAKSGYSIYADGQLSKFDEASNTKVTEFLSAEEGTLNVEVEATTNDDKTLTLVSIKNQ